MKLLDVFPTRTCLRLVDFFLANPGKPYMQSILVKELGIAPATARRTIAFLVELGMLSVDPRFSFVKVIEFNERSEVAQALLDFYKRLQNARNSCACA